MQAVRIGQVSGLREQLSRGATAHRLDKRYRAVGVLVRVEPRRERRAEDLSRILGADES